MFLYICFGINGIPINSKEIGTRLFCEFGSLDKLQESRREALEEVSEALVEATAFIFPVGADQNEIFNDDVDDQEASNIYEKKGARTQEKWVGDFRQREDCSRCSIFE